MTRRLSARDLACNDVLAQLGGSAEDRRHPYVREEAETMFGVWYACLVVPGLGTVRTDRLDDAMLPTGTTDQDLECTGCGLVSARSIRSVLKRLKASLPPGRHLPDSMTAYLKETGATVL